MDNRTRNLPGERAITTSADPRPEPGVPAIMDPETGMQEAVSQILSCLGEDPTRDGLRDTPRRVAKMYGELLCGYFQDLDTIVNGARLAVEYGAGEMVMASDIEYVSMCEHHMLPLTGTAHVAYIPKDRVIGLSKIPRIVDMFAHRLQVQERLTNEIADAVQMAISPAAVMVVLEGQHGQFGSDPLLPHRDRPGRAVRSFRAFGRGTDLLLRRRFHSGAPAVRGR